MRQNSNNVANDSRHLADWKHNRSSLVCNMVLGWMAGTFPSPHLYLSAVNGSANGSRSVSWRRLCVSGGFCVILRCLKPQTASSSSDAVCHKAHVSCDSHVHTNAFARRPTDVRNGGDVDGLKMHSMRIPAPIASGWFLHSSDKRWGNVVRQDCELLVLIWNFGKFECKFALVVWFCEALSDYSRSRMMIKLEENNTLNIWSSKPQNYETETFYKTTKMHTRNDCERHTERSRTNRNNSK